ncbi:hypothetical protein [Exilibacterium tricleocarpae]|nr:hypothetical protein [Exilibacterium tricleocarpae]
MVDALGNNRAFSNDAQYIEWRLANGYYATYSAGQAGSDPSFQAQVDAIRNAHSLTYSYRADGYLTAVVDQQGLQTLYEYDAADNLVAVTDRNGFGATNSDSSYYREIRRELGIVDSAGQGKVVAELSEAEKALIVEAFTSHFEYDDKGNLLAATDNADNLTTFTYTGFNKIASSTSAVGNALVNSDDQQYQEQRIELGYAALIADLSAADIEAILTLHTTFFDYDTNQNLIERRDAGGDITRFAYDSFGNQIKRTVFLDAGDLSDPDKQQVTQLFYDAFGNNIRTIDAEGNVTHSAFDQFGNVTQFIDGNGGVTSFTYDADDRLLSVTDPEGHTTTNTYDAVGNRISVTDANGHTVTRVFDRNNNLIATVDPSETDPLQDRTTRFEYDVVGNRTVKVDAEGRRTEFTFNGRRELVETTTAEVAGADGVTPIRYSSTFAYDGEGNRIRTTNNRGFATDILYTRNNLVRQQTDPDGQVTRIEYDANNNQLRVIAGLQLVPALRQVLTFRYDEENQLVSQTDAEGNVTTFAYDAPGNRVAFTDANGNINEFEYDGNNRLVREIRPEVIDPITGNPVRYTVEHIFDANGNEIETIDENGNSTRFLFDRDDKLVLVEDANGVKTVFQYDSRENRTAVIVGADVTVEEPDPNAEPAVVVLSYDDFETGLGNYVDGGADMQLYTGGSFAHQGNNAANIQDNSGVASSFFHGASYDISEFSTLEIDFWYYAVSMENNEDFFVQLWDGSSWQTVATFARGVDFSNNEFKRAVVSISSRDYNFSSDARVRFMADASSNGDDIYIDEIEVRGVGNVEDAGRKIIVNNVDQAKSTRFIYDEFNQLIGQVDGVGNALSQSDAMLYRLLRQELGFAALVADLSPADQQALSDLYTQRFTYDKVGNQLTALDNLQRTTAFQYDALNRLVTNIDALGQATRFTYDGNANRVSQLDAEGRLSRFDFDSVDRLTDTIDPLGVVTHRDYDTFGNLTAETRAFGTDQARTTNFQYDLNNRVIAQVDPEGHSQGFEYDALGNRIRFTDARGNDTRFIYNALNRNVRILDPLSFETRLEYDGVGNRISLIDARGGLVRFEYDPGNRRISTTDAQGRTTTFAYDVRGNRVESRTAAGTGDEQLTVFDYDAEGNLRRVIDAEGGITENDYDRVYNRTTATDANGNATTTEFDAVDRVVRVTDAEGQVTLFAYDAVGNRLLQTDALGRSTQFAYDDNDRLIRQTTADNIETQFGFDLVGNRVTVTRAANTPEAATDTFGYDLDDRLVSQTDAAGNTTTFAYDENDNRTLVTDANGNTSVFSYDANNRVVEIQDPESNIVRYTYDGNGNRTQVIDARGHATTSFYNASNEVTVSVDAEGYATAFVYDNNGNVVSRTLHMQPLPLPVDPASAPVLPVTAADQTTLFEYDRLSRVVASIDAEGFRTEFAYDAVGNRLQTRQFRNLAGTDIAVTHSYYDAVNREVAAITAEGYLTEYAYDAVGNRTRRTLFDQRVIVPASGLPAGQPGDAGRTEVFAYDLVNRQVRATSALGVVTDFEYDNRSNRIAIIEAAGSDEQRITRFAYDTADRLIDTIDAQGTITRSVLDANGNTLERRDAFATAAERVITFTFDGNNRVVSQTDALGAVTRFVYDGNGNLTAKTLAAGLPETRTETFEYDRENRRTAEVNGAGEGREFAYDGAGNRIRLTLAPGLAEARTNTFEYDRDNRMVAGVDGEGVRTEYRYDGADNKIETIQATAIAGQQRHSFYVYDQDNRLLQVTDPIGGVTEYEYDVLGNQTQVTDANGGIQTNSFDSLGRLVSTVSAGGILTSNTYDLRGNTTSTTQSAADGTDARRTVYGYDLLDRQVLVTDPEGFSTTFQYDVFGNQTLVTHGQYLPQPGDSDYDAAKAARAIAQDNAFTYDAADRLLSLTDGVGNITAYTYDAVGNRTSVTEAANSQPRLTTFTYDLANRVLETSTPEGGVSRNSYDQTGNRVAEARLQSDDGTTQVWSTTTFEYDGNARLTAQVDSYGTRTEFIYDAMGNQLLIRSAAGTADERVTRKEYDLNNRVSAEIDGETNRSEFAYDSLGNRIRVTDALGRVARYYFDGSNNLIAILDAEGYVNAFLYDAAGNRSGETIFMTRYTGPVDDFIPPVATPSADDRVFTSVFDGNSRLVQRIESDGSTTLFEYDAAGNVSREVQFADTAAPRQLSYVYDLNNRLTTFTDVDGTVTTFTYDGANNKTSETLSNPLEPGAVRQTLFEYDLNNRLVREIFDPSGLNLVQSIEYDLVGNAIANTDANGNTTRSEYDLNNRVVRQVDALNNDTLISYDAVGNQIAVTDANGNTRTFAYDRNNRVVLETLPSVSRYAIDGGFEVIVPTLARSYDAAGNEVQVVDAEGNITTRYFDSNDRLVAEINGDNAFREFTFNAAGEMLSETLYMTRLAAAAQDPAVRPAAPAGESRITAMEYDLLGRVTRITLPAITVTTLIDAGTDSPSFTTATVSPQELFAYDAYGNQIEIIDRNGNRTVAYYDAKDRLVAQVDGEGYLTEFDYDSQDNVLEQRNYTQRLDLATLDPAVRPTPPAGEVYQTNRVYDVANRLIEEHSPQVEVFDPATLATSVERVITRYTYDGVGNQTSRTLAADSAQMLTEYSYFDALNREVAVIDGNRVINVFGFDANGNQTLAKRYFNTLAVAVDPTTLDGGTNFAALVADNVNDQEIRRLYDALNRLSAETELMGPGGADDLLKSFGYDANGNRSRSVDEDGFVQQFSYDSNGNLLRSISPDNSGSIYEYDTAGNQIFAFTGQLDSVPLPASNIGASLGDSLTFDWTLPSGANVQSYVVYDTASRSDPNTYANQSVVQGTWFSETGSVSIPTSALTAGDTVFFRVVTEDAVGSLTWTAEQSVTLPPRINDIAVAQTAADTLEISVQFDAGVVDPEVAFGMPGTTTTTVSMVDLGGGLYRATLTGVTNPQELAFRIQWQDDTGAGYASEELPFEAQGGHLGVSSALTESTVMVGADNFYRVNVDTTLPSAFGGDLLGVSATWVNSADAGIRGSASVEGIDSGLGFVTFPIVIGAGDNALEAGTYTVTLRAVGEVEDTILDTFEVTVGSGLLTDTRRSASWSAAPVGDSQVVVVNGERAMAVREGNRLVVDPGLDNPGSVDYSVFYGTAFSDTHTTTVTSTEITETDTTTMPPTVTVLGYDLSVSAVLSAAEAAAIDGDVRLSWRAAGSGTEFANEVVLAATGSTFETTLALLAAGQYDLKIHYLNSAGEEVIVDWLRVDTAEATLAVTDNSIAVAATETNGAISLSADDTVDVDPGLYSGPLDLAAAALTLQTLATGNLGATVQRDGSDTGYFVENRYDALNNLIATNGETGVWREFGVDANGNRVVTQSFGDEGAPNPITSFNAYDSRNREVAQFAPQVDGQQAVTRFEYDLQDNITLIVDALGGQTRRTWNALGSQLTEQDQLFNTTTFRYDRLGRNTAEIDALGNTQYKRYDKVGNLIQTIDGRGDAVDHVYDVFGRRIQMSNALGQSVDMTYDQRDRLVRAEDALGFVTRYEYDGRGNRTLTVDGNGNESRQVWDGLGRVGETVTRQNGQAISERNQYDAYGNLVAEVDGAGRITTKVYGAFGRLLQQIDAGGRITAFDYDEQGRVVREFSANGKDIRRSYDAAGRLLAVNDVGTGVSTTYTYDLAGKRLTEVVTTPGNAHNRNVSYAYDAIGQMVRWADTVTGMQTNYNWDAAGNLAHAFTDLGYDPDNEGLAAGTRFVDHQYSYDANNRVIQQTQRGAIEVQYSYDAAGNRVMVNHQGTVTDYLFDANGRVIRAESGGTVTADWAYDNVGNVTRFRTFDASGAVDKVTTRQYHENNRNFFTNDDGQQTTLTLDGAGNVTRTKLVDDGDTFYFDHIYNAAGQETRINARGKDVGGRTINNYDVNDNLVELDKGEGDNQDRRELLRFVYNNDGQILYRFNDTGKGDDIFETEFAYANRNPVGQTGETEDAASETLLDTGAYNLVQPLGEDFPNSAVTFITASAGDTLEGIAAAVYGNPSLWFVLAEANGLLPGEPLTEGQRLQIPNTVKTGRLTADTHVVYNEGDIIGSTLPNLKSDPKDDGCGSFLAIIIVVIIAVVAVIATAGLAGAFLGAAGTFLGLSGTAATVAAFAVAGAIVGAAASIVQQGLFIALGYQDEFSWRSVAAGAISGALSGAAQGFGQVAAVSTVADTVKFAKTSARALQVASAASRQLIESGKITSWSSLAAAGLGPVRGVGADGKVGNLIESVGTEVGGTLGTALNYVTPWLGAAETFIRTGEVAPADWVSNLGSTLSSAITGDDGTFLGLQAAETQRLTTLITAGVLTAFDKDAGLEYIAGTVGSELAGFIGQRLAGAFGLAGETGSIARLRQNIVNAEALAASRNLRPELLFASFNDPRNDSLFLDEEGNPLRLLAANTNDPVALDDSLGNALSSELVSNNPFTGLGGDDTDTESLAEQIRARLAAEGASAEQIEDVFQSLDLDNALGDVVAVGQRLDDLRNQPILLASTDDTFLPDQRTTLDTLINTAAPVLETLGQLSLDLSEQLDRPLARFALIALDIAGGPVKFAVREAVLASPIGDAINDGVEFAFQEATALVVAATGFDEERAGKVVVGTLAVAGAAIIGGKFLRRNLPRLAASFRNRVRFANPDRRVGVDLSNRDTVSVRDARRLDGPNRGLIFVREPQGDFTTRPGRFEAGTTGAASDVASGSRSSPSLRFDNPAASSNPGVNNFVRFDGIEADGVTLIDRKTALTTKAKQINDLARASEAVRQNPNFRLVFEFPDQSSLESARRILRSQNITNIATRVAP